VTGRRPRAGSSSVRVTIAKRPPWGSSCTACTRGSASTARDAEDESVRRGGRDGGCRPPRRLEWNEGCVVGGACGDDLRRDICLGDCDGGRVPVHVVMLCRSGGPPSSPEARR